MTATLRRDALLIMARSAHIQEEPRKALRHLRAAGNRRRRFGWLGFPP